MSDRPRVLLIDDNRDNLRVAVAHLEAAGISTRTARDGQTGIDRARNGRVDLILLDVQMPGLDGYATCERLKADPDLAGIPVVFTTARTRLEDKVRAFGVGAVDYITKPFEAPELLARVRTHLEVRRLQQELAAQNATLEQRVREQVAHLEHLNAQLRAQIEDRSEALSRALARLEETRWDDDLVEPGLLLDGRYRVDERIAGGGMGTVFRGVDVHTDATVAIKVVRPSSASPMELLQRFLKEARLAAAVTHPAIVRMLHVDIHEDGVLYQVQDYVEGCTLEAALRDHGSLPDVAPALLAVLADALAAAHAAGVVHRDVKPSNVVLTADAPGLKLIDFGISKRAEAFAETLVGRDRTGIGVVLGTPEYMSPEQLRGALEVGTPTDVYALGVLAHRVYTGAYPGRTTGSHVEPAVMEAIEACLAEVPEARPSAADLATRFGALAADGPPLALRVRAAIGLDGQDGDLPTTFPSGVR
ncbi:MAG: response regulator [Alphaproteobacteria bacterium]|nr:response regulator [Alphaproteobacteria bacterium]